MNARRITGDERGFTLVEVLVAAVILVVGVLGTVALIDGANAASQSTKAREQGVSLQRELIESARSIPYSELVHTSIVSKLQSGDHLGDSNLSSPGWTIRRRGVTYSVSTGVCTVDDARDGTGTHDPASFCASGAGTTTAGQCKNFLGIDGAVDNLVEASVDLCLLGLCVPPSTADVNPDDYKRIVTLVRWDRGQGTRYALQSTTVPNPGLSAGPSVTNLTPTPSGTITTGSSIAFVATTSRTPATVSWSVDGTTKGTAAGALTVWNFTWALGNVNATEGGSSSSTEVLDGAYVVAAKAFDQFGVYGATRAKTITLNRRDPYKPTGFRGGRTVGVIDFEWAPNKERDIAGYRVYRSTGALACSTTGATSCMAGWPGGLLGVNYYVVALDKNAAGELREGDASSTATVSALNTRPNPPSNLAITASGNGSTTLTWSAASDPDLGDSIDFYRIYRDGATYADRYDKTGGSQLTYTDTKPGGTTHTYRITAVDTQLAESSFGTTPGSVVG